MQAQDTAGSPAEQDAQTDGAILGLVLDSPVPWSILEIERELGDSLDTTDGLARLAAAGLVHRLGCFVWPTRAAARASELAG